MATVTDAYRRLVAADTAKAKIAAAERARYLTARDVARRLDSERRSRGGLVKLAAAIRTATGSAISFQHLGRVIMGQRKPQGAVLKYLRLERCVLYRQR